jgi:glutathione S-transferase
LLTLYSMIDSGNCYKPRLLMAKLGIRFRHVEMHAFDGSTRSPEFLAKNPNGKVPLLQFEDGRTLSESNAILLHLAEGTRFLPEDPYMRALVYQWMFFEQYSHEPNIAVRRSLIKHKERVAQATPDRMDALLQGGSRALGVMETALRVTPFIAGETMSAADIALYAYTHEAEDAGFDLEKFPNLVGWLSRVAADPGHVPIDWLP